MSKKTKIILSVVVIILVIAGGIFGYLVYTGKVKLKATQPGTGLNLFSPYKISTTNRSWSVQYRDLNKNDAGRFTYMSVDNRTYARGIDKDAVIVQPGDEVQLSCELRANKDLKNPYIYINKFNNDVMEPITIPSSILRTSSCSPVGTSFTCFKGPDKISFVHNGQPGVIWTLQPGTLLKSGDIILAVSVKIKDAQTLIDKGYSSGQTLNIVWAAGWLEGKSGGTKISSGKKGYLPLKIKLKYGKQPDYVSIKTGSAGGCAACQNDAAMLSEMTVKNNSAGRGNKDGVLRAKKGDELTFTAILKVNQNQKAINPFILFGTEDSANTNWTRNMSPPIKDSWLKSSANTHCPKDAFSAGYTKNGKFGYSRPCVYAYISHMHCVPSQNETITLQFKVKIKDNYQGKAIFGYAAGWDNAIRIWSGDGKYPHLTIKIVP